MELNVNDWTFPGGVVGKTLPGQLKTQVRIITLNDGEHLRSTLHNVEKGWIIVFRLGPNLYGKDIYVFTNHPESAEDEFDRHEYRQLKWRVEGTTSEVDDEVKHFKDVVKSFAQLPLRRAGSFDYYFVEKKGNSFKTIGSGYFTVNPVLSVGYDEEKVILLDSVQCQTVLAKCLGPFEEWLNRLLVSKESGYNVIHLTPVQELGSSNSSYSIKDHLKINPSFGEGKVMPLWNDISNLTNTLKEECDILCISDIVLNHTSNETPWLLEHPDCTYNMVTAPYLIPAAILDGHFQVFNRKVAKGDYTRNGIPRQITVEYHVQAVKWILESEIIPRIRMEEYFQCDVESIVAEFLRRIKDVEPLPGEGNTDNLVLKYNPALGRNKTTVDMDTVVRLFNRKSAIPRNEAMRVSYCERNLRRALNEKNCISLRTMRNHLRNAVENIISNIRHQRIQSDGPMIREISEKNPLIPRYFTGEFKDYESVEDEVLNRGQFVMAHNGWVTNFDPLKNFAGKESDVYLRRELVVWDDTVKLRYGQSPDNCPFLWDRMRKYVELSAEIFHGFRLDNCHSTPLPVGEYMMDCARKIRPDLFIVAELFTDCDDIDNIFINRLGITSVIREEMRAWSSEELTRLIYSYGGQPVGSFYNSAIQPLIPSSARALFYDVTHDNESLIEKRGVFSCLPTTALVNMTCCGTGSTRGFDELVPHKIDVVNEYRKYKSWSDINSRQGDEVSPDSGIVSVKKRLNELHKMLNDEGYSEIYIDLMDEDIITITRHNPSTHNGVILIAYTAYDYPEDISLFPEHKMLKFEGQITKILLEASISNIGELNHFSKPEYFCMDVDFINGLWEYIVKTKVDIAVDESTYLFTVSTDDPSFSEYELQYFLPGSIIVAETSPKPQVKPKVEFMINLANALVEKNCHSIIDISSRLTLEDLNFVLYYCSKEGLEAGCGSYHIPGYGSMVYCGLQGFSSMLHDAKRKQDLGHPFCQNLRDGDWMLDYISERFKNHKNTEMLGSWFEEAFDSLKYFPRFLIPRYFELIVNSVIDTLHSCAKNQMSEFVRKGSTFVTALALGSVQCIGSTVSSTLPTLSPTLELNNPQVSHVNMSAGLPHFSTGTMRSWGRDTFISLRGFMLLTGRYDVARCHILAYASCLRHGLIPNLLDSGVEPRYNSRDAVWWWLYSIVSYVKLVPEGFKILNDPVSRIFATDDTPRLNPGLLDQPLHHLMQEALDTHFKGLTFREKNAGSALDPHMTNNGFNIEIGVNLTTGFVYGGNKNNCGTWMDKMGTSLLAGNRGQPATPRDGSAVELVGLCKRVLHELIDLHEKGHYPYNSVKKTTSAGEIIKWTFKEWEEKIAKNFDKYFWVDSIDSSEEKNPQLVHRHGIYKDSFGASQTWADYQLRCNFLIALTLAPEMVDPEKAWKAIEKAEIVLMGPLGIRTLDPADWNYHGDYHTEDNSNNPKVAQGFNYHQGPEWIWPVAYYLRAKLHFAKLRGPEELKKSLGKIWAHLGRLYENLLTTQWRALPELTNAYGSHCSASCNVQAWSMACILEVLYDLTNLEAEAPAELAALESA